MTENLNKYYHGKTGRRLSTLVRTFIKALETIEPPPLHINDKDAIEAIVTGEYLKLSTPKDLIRFDSAVAHLLGNGSFKKGAEFLMTSAESSKETARLMFIFETSGKFQPRDTNAGARPLSDAECYDKISTHQKAHTFTPANGRMRSIVTSHSVNYVPPEHV